MKYYAKRVLWSLGAAFCLLPTVNASAVERSIPYPLTAVATSGSCFGGLTDIVIGKTCQLYMNFVLPDDYQTNEPVKIVFYLTATSTPCTATIGPHKLERFRIGAEVVDSLEGFGAVGRLTTVDFPSPDGVILEKTYLLQKGSTIADQRPRDAFVVAWERQFKRIDTCGSVSLKAINITYPAVTDDP